MFFVIDIGNTNITLGLFEMKADHISLPGVKRLWRISTGPKKTADEYGTIIIELFRSANINVSGLQAVAVASVVPSLDVVFETMIKAYFKKKAFFVTSATRAIEAIVYDDPREVGADRIANAAAAWNIYGGPAIVIDFGTATTFDCISAKGEYLGGAIAPGPLMSAESLAERTAKLPKVEIIKPRRSIGKSTTESIQAGLYFGYVGLVKEILQRISGEMKGKPKIIATGGLASLIIPEIHEVDHVAPDLTLEGIRIIWENANKK